MCAWSTCLTVVLAPIPALLRPRLKSLKPTVFRCSRRALAQGMGQVRVGLTQVLFQRFKHVVVVHMFYGVLVGDSCNAPHKVVCKRSRWRPWGTNGYCQRVVSRLALWGALLVRVLAGKVGDDSSCHEKRCTAGSVAPELLYLGHVTTRVRVQHHSVCKEHDHVPIG